MIHYQTIKVFIVSALIIGSWAAGAAPARSGRAFGGETEQANPQQTRREQMRLEAQATHSQIKSLLGEVLGLAVKNQAPSKALVQQCSQALEENKQNALAYTEIQRADYMLLQAWTGFYQDSLPEALNWSMRACKQDEGSQDAWNSQAVFNMLFGKRPLEPKIERPKMEPEMRRSMSPRPRRNNTVEPQKYDPEPYSTKGVLDFDLLSVRADLFRERFERMEFLTTSGTSVEYVPGRDIFCALFYQSEGAVEDGDPNGPGANGSEMPRTGTFMMQGYTGESGAIGIDSQRQYFLNLMKACKNVKTIKFLQVDTIRPKDLSAISLSSYDNKGIATVIPANPGCNAKRLACDASKPFMMIVDTDGSVKYAGPAAGFAAAFILTKISGQAISLEDSAMGSRLGALGAEPFGEQPFMLRDFGADPNAPTADPNRPQAIRVPERMQAAPGGEPDFPGQELMDEYDAQKLLQLAEMKIEQSRKVRGSNPRDGIIAARKVIEKYPNTPEAQKAKELLRRVPDRYKNQYNITEEELL
jgi:hypothetical protein